VLPVVTSCDEHETDNREPGDREGNDHVVVLSILGPCSVELRPFERTLPEQSVRKVVVGLGDAPSNACMSGR